MTNRVRNALCICLVSLLPQHFAAVETVEVTLFVSKAWNLPSPAKKAISRYCYFDASVPYSCPGETWEAMPTSSGRVATVTQESTNPTFSIKYRIIATDETRTYVNLFDKDDKSLGVANFTFDGLAIPDAGLVEHVAVHKEGVGQGIVEMHFYKGNKEGLATESTEYEPAIPISKQQVVKIEDTNGYGPMIVGVAPLPENLQGLWWLTNQGASSALVTFGGPNFDGAGCNTGLLDPEGKTRVRVEGERSFSTAQATYADKALQVFDGVYNFDFNIEEEPNPTYAKITVSSASGVPYTGGKSFFSSFTMKYLENGLPAEYPGAKVWLRETSFIGVNAGHDYYLVQVVDGNRQKINGTWQKFEAYMSSVETGWTPGWMWYPSKFPSPSEGAPEQVEKQESRARMKLIIVAILSTIGGCLAIACCFWLILHVCAGKGKRGAKTEPGDYDSDFDDGLDGDFFE